MNGAANKSNATVAAGAPFLLALGDCNTLGLAGHEVAAFPLSVARQLGMGVINCGHTMSTIREGWEYAQRQLTPATAVLLVQFGLADSWVTFRGAPYVLYYPDNLLRRALRKVVKKYKKIGRRLNFIRWFGAEHVVTPPEYERNLVNIIELARQRAPRIQTCLISTVPTLEPHRNGAIHRFNEILHRVASGRGCYYVDVVDEFDGRADRFIDAVHLTDEGHEIIARRCVAALRSPAPMLASGSSEIG